MLLRRSFTATSPSRMRRRRSITLSRSLVNDRHLDRLWTSLFRLFAHLFLKGRGSFGSVKKAVRLSDQKQVAIKVISKKTVKGHFDMVHAEMQVMQGLDHPNVIHFYDWFESRYTSCRCLQTYKFV